MPSRRATLAAFTGMTVAVSVLFGATGSQATFGQPEWVGTWATALTTASLGNSGGSLTGFNNESIRMIVRTSVGGERLRIRLSNEFGTGAVDIGHATVGRTTSAGSPDLVAGSIHELTFNGQESITMYRGAGAVSDPLFMDVPALTELAVTIYLATPTGQATWHFISRQNTYVYAGDRAESPSGAGQTVIRSSFYFLAGVDVARRDPVGSVVVLGDSISDGVGSTVNANTRWPDFLAARMVASPPRWDNNGVLNESLAGNQVTHDGIELGATLFGTSGLARLDTDVYAQTDVEAVIVELGVNDLNFSVDTAPRIIAGLKQLGAQLREHNLRALVCTLAPFEGFVGPPAWTPEKEAVRVAVNDYLRHQHDFDTLIDMDKVLRDPANRTRLLPAYDSGDHIHPNDAGARALADAVPLNRL